MTSDQIINSITTLISVFAGAWAAFAVQNFRTKKEIRNKNIAAANRALYTIFNLWNILFQFQKEVINPIREKHDTWFNMPATQPSSYGLTAFQADELAFLLQTEHANTYSEILLEEQRFWVAIKLIEMRSSILLNQVHPRMGAAGIPVGGACTEEQIQKIIGIDTTHKLKQITSGIIKNVDEDIESLKSAHNQLRDVMKKIYPEEKFVHIEFDKAKT